jgi:TrmH RNA methyltransferase
VSALVAAGLRACRFRAPNTGRQGRLPLPAVVWRVFCARFRFVGGVKRKEITICGLAAVKAQFEADPKSIVRLFFDQPTGRKIGAICKALAQAKKVYRCVEPAELEKVAGSIHHGGIVAIAEASELRAPATGAPREWARRRETLLVLDRVGNAHNLGAIARTAAYFGIPRLILPEDPAAALPGDAAYRVAEGGLAHLEILRVRSLPSFLRELALAGYDVVGAATRGGRPETKGAAGKPIALVLGNEEHGLAPAVVGACTRLVTLPGSGKVESLNVSVAAAILIWELIARR